MNTVLMVLLVLSNAAAQASVPRPVRVAGPGYEGAIVSAEELLASDPQHLLKPSDVWTPSEGDIREAEQLLPEYVKSLAASATLRGTRIPAELARYYRQYLGRLSKGERVVSIQFFHAESSVGKEGLWHEGLFGVMGGGEQFFRVTYHVETKRFSGLQVNAPE